MKTIVVRTVDDYWKDFVISGYDMKRKNPEIRDRLVNAFRKEIVELTLVRTGCESLDDIEKNEKNEKLAKNILDQAQKKWLGLIKRCDRYKETRGMLDPSDLMNLKLLDNLNA